MSNHHTPAGHEPAQNGPSSAPAPAVEADVTRPLLECVGALRSLGINRPSSKVCGATPSPPARMSSIAKPGSRNPCSSALR